MALSEFEGIIFEVLLQLILVFGRIAAVGVSVLVAFTFASIAYLCFNDLTVDSGKISELPAKAGLADPDRLRDHFPQEQQSRHASIR